MRSNIFFWSAIWLLTPNFNSLSHYQGDKLAQAMLISVSINVRPEGHWEPRNEFETLRPVERLVGSELGIFCFIINVLID